MAWLLPSPLAEETFRDPSNAAAFQKLQKRIRRIAWALGVSEINMTGTMPSYLAAKGTGILPLVDNRPVVAGAVTEAAREVRDTRFGGQWPPVILIGAGGYIGRPLAEALRAEGSEVYSVDPALGINALPEDLRGRPALVIDAARKGVLEGYLPEMWPGLMILNETFPAPRRSLVAQLDGRGIEVWHLAGLEGRVTPPLPHGYEGAVPCCAAHGLPDPVRVKLANLTERARGRAALSRPEPAQVPALAPEGS